MLHINDDLPWALFNSFSIRFPATTTKFDSSSDLKDG